MYPRGETPVPVAGKEFIEVTLPGRGRYDEKNRPYLDFFGVVVRAGRTPGMFLRADRLMAVPIRGHAILRPPNTEPGHTHLNYGELWLILEGKTDLLIEGGPFFTADAGQLMYVPAGRVHAVEIVPAARPVAYLAALCHRFGDQVRSDVMKMPRVWMLVAAALLGFSQQAAAQPPRVDLLIRNGTIYDGRGDEPVRGDVAIDDGRVVATGQLDAYAADQELDAQALAIAPGFINVLSWAPDSLIHDGRGMSDIKQGVTLEIFGEGLSYGPLTEISKAELEKTQSDIRYDVTWTTLGEFLEHLVARGVSLNVASFVGSGTVRVHELGYANRAPSADELARMQDVVRAAMREGAVGVGSALIYAPDTYAKTDELIALASAAGEYGGAYISHLRSEGDRFLESLEELIEIARAAKVHAEVHHLKAAGEKNWPKMRQAIERIEQARSEGLSITANMYPYTAAATGLDAAMPPWVQEGGIDAWVDRLEQPQIRARVLREMRTPATDWENLLLAAGSPLPRRAPRLSHRCLEAAHRQDARRGCNAARAVARGRGDRPRHRGSLPHLDGLCPDVGGKRETRSVAAVGEHRFGRTSIGTRRRVPA